jgi:hypothetical protein
MRNKKILLSFTIIILLTMIIVFVTPINAYTARSESKELQWGNMNLFSERGNSENYYIVDTGGQLGVDIYSSENYKIMAGFGYYYSIIPFSFVIDYETDFDFPSLRPNTPQTAVTQITVTSGAAHGYIVTAYQNHQLEKATDPGMYIEDTLGDNLDITHQSEGIWELNTTPGFGYTLNNIVGTDAIFTNGYKQFADISNGEEPQPILENTGITRTSTVEIEYKLNIDSSQKSGYYYNNLNYKCSGTF